MENRKEEIAKRKQKFPFPISQCPLVSIIVTTKNEEKDIANCLESIKNQSLNSHFPFSNSCFPVALEIIVVDNNSTDDTVKIAKQFTSKIYTKGPESSAQGNFGVEKAISIKHVQNKLIVS